jgi:decaprenylphospho-beta-D-ribofuranose 2-oxidase
MSLSGWGRMPVVAGDEIRSEDLRRITQDVPLTRGLGRAYGDASLPAAPDTRVAGSRLADRILAFDRETGLLHAEAGLALSQIGDVFLPRGFFVPVAPGTSDVTLGGMVAADVHGKNHHRDGCFGEHVDSITLRVADGRIVTCSRNDEPELFKATIGGMGLTGHILDVRVRLIKVPSPWIMQETIPIGDIDQFVDTLRASSAIWPMTAGWIDCLSNRALGRGILYSGRWAEATEAPAGHPRTPRAATVPMMPPAGVLRPSTIGLFNKAYYAHGMRAAGTRVVDPHQFFYPLDRLRRWNLLYGPRGFIQYQCVLPTDEDSAVIRRFLQLAIRRRDVFLCVIKDCGAEGLGTLSFPKPGISLALDIPFHDGTQSHVDEMNEFVAAAGGRIYLAKDALTRQRHYRTMDSRVDRFLCVRRSWDPDGRIRSALSVRLFGW